MTTPLKTNRQKLGPIEVVQDRNHFLVHIHYENRDRAKKIAGYQWDGARRAWVYPKDLQTYKALVEEFQKDADTFDILCPKSKRPTAIEPPSEEVEGEEFEELPIDVLLQIRDMLGSLNDLQSNPNRSLEELRENQAEVARVLGNIESPAKQIIKTVKNVLPELLDFDKPKERLLFEKTLLEVAYDTSNKSESFRKCVEVHSPIGDPVKFVRATHEKLKQQLEKIVDAPDPRVNFTGLVKQIQKKDLIFTKPHDPIKVIDILYDLNDIRNQLVHDRGDFSPSEWWARSILYLMNLALVWEKINI